MYSRRAFIKSGLLVLAGPLIKPTDANSTQCLPSEDAHYLISPCLSSLKYNSRQNYLRIINNKTAEIRYVELPLLISHGLVRNPNCQFRQIIIERDGPYCAEVDVAGGKVIRKFSAKEGWNFSGHAAISKDGKLFAACEHPDGKHGSGKIVIRDYNTMKIVAEYSSYGLDPHDIVLMNNDSMIAVTNYGVRTTHEPKNTQSSLSFIDFKTGRLLAQESSQSESGVFFGHLTSCGNESVAVGNLLLKKRRGKIADNFEKKLLEKYEERKVGFTNFTKIYNTYEAPLITATYNGSSRLILKEIKQNYVFHFGVAYDEFTNIVGASHRQSQVVSFWNKDSGKSIWNTRLEHPTSIYFDKSTRKFICLSSTGEMIKIDPLKKEKSRISEPDKNFTGYFQVSVSSA